MDEYLAERDQAKQDKLDVQRAFHITKVNSFLAAHGIVSHPLISGKHIDLFLSSGKYLSREIMFSTQLQTRDRRSAERITIQTDSEIDGKPVFRCSKFRRQGAIELEFSKYTNHEDDDERGGDDETMEAVHRKLDMRPLYQANGLLRFGRQPVETRQGLRYVALGSVLFHSSVAFHMLNCRAPYSPSWCREARLSLVFEAMQVTFRSKYHAELPFAFARFRDDFEKDQERNSMDRLSVHAVRRVDGSDVFTLDGDPRSLNHRFAELLRDDPSCKSTVDEESGTYNPSKPVFDGTHLLKGICVHS